MQYYSKPPNQVQKEADKRTASRKRKIKPGHLIVIIDIVVIALIFAYFFKGGGNTTNPAANEVVTKHVAKSFPWKGWQIDAECATKKNCKVVLKQQSGSEKLAHIEWRLKERQTKDLLYQERQSIAAAAVVGLPVELGKQHQVYLRLLDPAGAEKLIFRVYP